MLRASPGKTRRIRTIGRLGLDGGRTGKIDSFLVQNSPIEDTYDRDVVVERKAVHVKGRDAVGRQGDDAIDAMDAARLDRVAQCCFSHGFLLHGDGFLFLVREQS